MQRNCDRLSLCKRLLSNKILSYLKVRACLHEGEPARIAELARLGEMIYRSVYMQGSTQPGYPGWPHLRFVNEIASTK